MAKLCFICHNIVFFEGQSCAIKHFLAHISPLFPSGDWIQKFVLLTNFLRFRDNPSDSLRLKRHAIMSALSEEPASRPASRGEEIFILHPIQGRQDTSLSATQPSAGELAQKPTFLAPCQNLIGLRTLLGSPPANGTVIGKRGTSC